MIFVQSTLEGIPGEIYASIIILIIISILSLIIFFKVRKADPLAKPKGILHLAEIGVSTFDNMVKTNMGVRFQKLAGYFLAVAFFLFLSFILGIFGIPSPMNYLMVPFSLALITFLMIHGVSIKDKKWGYFRRYIDPFPVFLPINLLSMWSPLLSMTFRMFGNAIAGWALMGLITWGLEGLGTLIFGALLPSALTPIFFAPAIMPWLHLYFDLFTAFIQTLVFISLSMILVAQEANPEAEVEKAEIVS